MAKRGETSDLSLDLDDLIVFPFYRHRALPTRESLRLVRLTSIPLLFGSQETQKLCTMETFTMLEAPEYMALSYTWGAPLSDDMSTKEYAEPSLWLIASSIPEDDGASLHDIPEFSVVKIGSNLQRLLLHFSQIPPKDIPYIWIDALCINQEDLVERSQQVARMMDIYAGCASTVVWLGDDARQGADVVKLWDLHQDLYPALMAHYYNENYLPDRPVSGWTMENVYRRLHLEHKKDSHDWAGYVRFFNERTWFSRAWVFQEVVFAPLVIYNCAGLIFDPDHIAAVAQFLRCTGLGLDLTTIKSNMKVGDRFSVPWIQLGQTARTRLQLRGIGTSSWLDKIADVSMTDSATHRIAAYTYWANTLVEVRSLDAKDKRDKIYATYGIIQQALSAVDLTPDPRLVPDYTQSEVQLYTNVTAVLLTEVADLTFLSEVEDPSLTLIHGLPSWVPDFSVRTHQSLFMEDLFTQYNASQCDSPRRVARNIIVNMSTIPCLTLKGISISAVKQTYDNLPVSTTACLHMSFAESQTRLLEAWKDLLEHVTNYGKCSRWKPLFHTLTAGHKKSHYHTPFEAKHFKAFITAWMMERYEEQTSSQSHQECIQRLDWTLISRSSDIDRKYVPSKEEVERFLYICYLSKADSRLVTKAEVAPVNSAIQDARMFNDLMGKYSIDKVLFATTNGLLGLGPRSMRPGDEVWLVQDARMLFTVRPTEHGDYTLLGETYVYRCMNGELMKYAEGKWRDLKLR